MSGSPGPEVGGRQALLAAAEAELVEHGHAAISLRAVARRAGVSHAAPKYHFRDRAGLLTAVAAEGFRALALALQPATTLDELGRAYVDFGLGNPALFDLMFRPSELHADDSDLLDAQQQTFARLTSAVVEVGHPGGAPDTGNSNSPPAMALISWAFVHGLVVLARDGAMAAITQASTAQQVTDLAHELTDSFTAAVTAHPSASP